MICTGKKSSKLKVGTPLQLRRVRSLVRGQSWLVGREVREWFCPCHSRKGILKKQFWKKKKKKGSFGRVTIQMIVVKALGVGGTIFLE